ncbi:uncharacterized protein TNCV_3312451 [Trichonephila clavipes]|nr:uncharacterized protein TNCV_3312451 [Trichonephila clavipes]
MAIDDEPHKLEPWLRDEDDPLPLRHGGTLNRRRATSPLVRLVEGEERWEALDHPKNWGGIELNRTFTCMLLKASDNDRCTTNPLP